MSQEVVLPALGESVTEGTVTRWLKSVGDAIAVDEPLVEISTDKVDTEIPSPVAGVVEAILVQEDETVEVGAVLARIGDGVGASSAPATPEPVATPEPEAAPVVAPEPVAAPAPVTPPVVAPPAPAPAVTAPPVVTPRSSLPPFPRPQPLPPQASQNQSPQAPGRCPM